MTYVPLTQIRDNPFQSQRDYSDIEELAERIRETQGAVPETYGLLQVPLGRLIDGAGDLVRVIPDPNFKLPPGYRVELAFGHRRFRAFQWLEENGGPVYEDGLMPVNLTDLHDNEMIDAVWSENNDRKDVTAVERAELMAAKLSLVKLSGGSQRTVAEAWGLARATVSNELRLLQLRDVIHAAIRSGRLSGRQGHSLANVVKLSRLLAERGGKQPWWGNDIDGSLLYGRTLSPENLITAVIDRPEEFSSHLIRKVSRAQLKNAGNQVPSFFSKHPFDAASTAALSVKEYAPVRQTACAGCPLKLGDWCFDEPCLDAKKLAWQLSLATEAAEELGYKLSRTKSHFPDQYDKVAAIVEIHKAGGCNHMRVGANDGNQQARPWVKARPFSDPETAAIGLDRDFVTHESHGGPYQKGDRSVVCLGHAGNPLKCHEEINAEALAGEQAKKDDRRHEDFALPPEAIQNERLLLVGHEDERMEERLKTYLSLDLESAIGGNPATYEAISAILTVFDNRWNNVTVDPADAARNLVELAFKNGDGLNSFQAVARHQNAHDFLFEVGADPDLADPEDPILAFRLHLLRPLCRWYKSYQHAEYDWNRASLADDFARAAAVIEHEAPHDVKHPGDIPELIEEALAVKEIIDRYVVANEEKEAARAEKLAVINAEHEANLAADAAATEEEAGD